jgi:tetratricopeptide (TPR) repeat protein
MALVDPYSPCPCGSGQKFKWCCHKVEAVAERAHRLFESGQIEAAVAMLDEGLRKEKGNAWLLSRKALYLTRAGKVEPAKEAIRLVLQKNPSHAGAQMLMTRLVLESEGAAAGAAQLQQALTAFPPDRRKDLAGLIKVVGAFLSEAAEFPAALRHLRLAQSFTTSEPDAALNGALRAIESNATISPWLKNPDALSPAPSGLSAEIRDRFEQALGWAGEGLWSSAAAAFETLTSDPVAGALADRNLGFCRLWLADDAAAAPALRRYVSRLGATAEAVDIEALCQQIAPSTPESEVEHVQLTWPVRNRQALIDALNADPAVHREDPGPIDPDDENSPNVEQFVLLDRPEKEATTDLKVTEVPRIVGRVFIATDITALEAFDDGRLDRLADRFTALAGAGIVPAHPRTKILGRVPRLQLALTWEWLMPDGVDATQSKRLSIEQGVYLINEIWPNTPNPAFRGRTPLQAARAGDSEVPLRAAVFQFELSQEAWREEFDFAALRARLRIPAEPPIDPETVDIETLHLARLALLPVADLGVEKLVGFYRRARRTLLEDSMGRAARVLVDRPEAMERLGVESLSVYTDLASLAASNDRHDEAFEWVRRGRQAGPPAKRLRDAAAWDMFEVRLRARIEPPETWVPEIAVILDRYSQDARSNQTIVMNLIDMGLLEMVPNPDRSGEVLLDSRRLQTLMAEYGPRVTTASGRLGVSATKPEIWTPGSPGGGSGELWTPGGGSALGASEPGGEKKLIIPGR